ncbi:MAG: ion transporter [Pseudomonadota bacterium]
MSNTSPSHSVLRARLNTVIFGTETPAGRLFDLVLTVCILLSVLVALLDSVPSINARFHSILLAMEWMFTLLFTLEYTLRLYSAEQPRRYALSFFGIVDLGSILPAYLSLLFPAASYLLVFRLLRIMRIFRILKLMRFVGDANILVRALMQSRRKILIFLFTVVIMNIIFGSLMYVVEGPENGFTSIPVAIYWSIVTLTTVGYGDISPHTGLGQFIASLAMITGYAIIAVPTGIVSSELMNEYQTKMKEEERDYQVLCSNCLRRGHDRDAHFCKQCGSALPGTNQN